MSEKKTSTVTLDIELQDLLDVVSKSGTKSPLSNETSTHAMEGEELKKAWFKHVLISLEKLNDQVESIRREEIPTQKSELKKEIENIKIELKEDLNSIKEVINKAEAKASEAEKEFKDFKKTVIEPLSNTVLTLTVKLGVWSIVAGFVGSGIMGLAIRLVQEFVIKPAVTGSH